MGHTNTPKGGQSTHRTEDAMGSMILTDYTYQQPQGGIWPVESPKGQVYMVDISLNCCTCPVYIARRAKLLQDCKHLKSVKAILCLLPWADRINECNTASYQNCLK